jgi:hypothetical protein
MRFMMMGLALLAACSKAPEPAAGPAPAAPPIAAAPEPASPRLEPLWIAEGFSAPEGVALAPDGNYFISNVAGEGETKDGVGWISKVSPSGEVVVAKFIEGLDEPKGMATLGGVLFVADIDRVRTFDAATGAAGATIPIEGAKFLNDATSWNGEVYVSDSGTATIWRLTAEGPVKWREGEELSGVNGLLGDGDKMFVSTMSGGYLFEATSGGGWREIASGMIDADGIGLVPGGGYLVSAWPGEIHHVAEDGAVASILNTREAGILQNDLTMFGDVVIVPNWMPGTVTAWRIVR